MKTLAPTALVLATLGVAGAARPAAAALPAGFSDALFAAVPAPTDVAFTADGLVLVTSQTGTLRVFDTQGNLVATALSFPSSQICFNSERGLLGVAADPLFGSVNRFVYVFYTRPKIAGNCTTASPATASTPVNRVSRFTLDTSAVAVPGSEVVLLDEMPSPGGNHNAGDLGFGKDGYLYVTIGDGGSDYAGGGSGGTNDAARDENVLTGKLLRIAVNANGTTAIPPGNPFQGPESERCALTGRTVTAGKTRCQETFSWGLRNPFRLAFDPNAGGTRVFVNDVGQNAREEIDEAAAGADFGWNCREGTFDNPASSCVAPGAVEPVYDYGRTAIPGTTASGCASITGGAFVPNGLWPAAYDGAYLFADYVCGWIFRLTASGPYTAADFATSLGGSSATSLAFGPDGSGGQALYYTSYAGGGQVRRIRYAVAGNNPPIAVVSGAPLGGPVPLVVTFSAAGSSDPDAGDTLTYFWDFGDGSAEVQTTATSVQHTYTSEGTFIARLRARDDKFAFSPAATLVVQPGNTPPVASIDAPSPGALFAVGETVTLQGSATDAQEGTLPGSQLSWSVILHHDAHTHPFLGPITGAQLAFAYPAPEDLAAASNSYLEAQLTATDLVGASQTVSLDLLPHTVEVSFETVPTGLTVEVNGSGLVGPQTVTSWEGYALRAFAPYSQGSGPQVFSSWSVGAGNPVTIQTPAAPATYTATYQASVDEGPQGFFTLAPCRLVDTRGPAGPRGGPALAAGATRSFPLREVCGVPATARALAVNLAVVSPSVAGFLRAWAADALPPGTSVVNFAADQTRSANAVVPLAADGTLAVSAGMASGTVHLVLDVVGYFE